jgi:NAD(P)-dependent dehydrogenase (short-subunit alcohol dehydrogenase family)
MSFDEKSVLITGASSGIGRATALAFANEGASLLLADVNIAGGAETVRLVEAGGGTAHFIETDVTQNDAVEAMVAAALSHFGRLDIAINNAGVGGAQLQSVSRYPEESFDSVMAVNVKGIWLCMRHEVPVMLQHGGAIVNVASVAGLIGFPGNAAYAASKHAVLGLTKSTALETASKGIRVNAVCPSYVDTPMVGELTEGNAELEARVNQASPMRRLGTADEVAQSILWLASPAASFVNGAYLSVDGGLAAM